MVRFVIIGIVIAAAFTLYALIDAAMSDPARSRGLSKPVWVVLVVVLPVIGAILWFTIGKARGPLPAPARAPDDDPRFSGSGAGRGGPRMSDDELDRHVRELEERLRELDAETFPGEERPDETDPSPGDDRDGGDGGDDAPATEAEIDPAGADSERPDRPGESPSSRQ